MAKTITLFTGSRGLNNKADPAKIKFNPKTGISDMAACSNVVIEDSRRPSRRKGYTRRLDGSTHSLFSDGGDCLFVMEETGQGALCFLHPDYSYTPVRVLTPNARMNYEQVDNVIYYMNGYERGKVRKGDFQSYAWNMGTYVGPETKRVFSSPPVGIGLAYYKGRMYVVQGKVVWASEDFDVSLYDLANSFMQFEDNVILIRPVIDGLFIGTEKKVIFLKGSGPSDMSERTVADYPAIKGTDCKFVGKMGFTRNERVTISSTGGTLYAIWMSQKGVCVGGPEGQFVNITEDRLVLPPALTGAGLVYDNKYIGNMNP